MFFFLKIISRLPLWLLYAVAEALACPLGRVYRRKLVKSNLKLVFPQYPESQIKAITNKFYRHFCNVVVEVIKGTSISKKEMAKRIKFVNFETVFEPKEKEQPVLFYSLHQCNWEWMALASSAILTVPGYIIYKPIQNKKADRFIYDMRSRFGGRPIPKDQAARHILRLKNTHGIIGLVADQSPPRNQVHWARLFHIETDFYPGLAQLPYIMQVPAVFGRMTRKKRGYYEVELIKIGEPPYHKNDFSVLKNYIRETERLIEEYPEDYLWTHNRWKHTRKENEEIVDE